MPKATPFSYTIDPDNGSNTSDHYSSGNAAHALVLSGNGAKGDTIRVTYTDPVTHQLVTLTTIVQNSGSWSITTASLPEGQYVFSITETGTQSASATSPERS